MTMMMTPNGTTYKFSLLHPFSLSLQPPPSSSLPFLSPLPLIATPSPLPVPTSTLTCFQTHSQVSSLEDYNV